MVPQKLGRVGTTPRSQEEGVPDPYKHATPHVDYCATFDRCWSDDTSVPSGKWPLRVQHFNVTQGHRN